MPVCHSHSTLTSDDDLIAHAEGELAYHALLSRIFSLASFTRTRVLTCPQTAVCSAATKSSVVFTVNNLLGVDRVAALDVFMAGDDVPAKKPDPSIYRIASERLGVAPECCLVVEDSKIGLDAALGAGMRCLITYTNSTREQVGRMAWVGLARMC